MGVGGADLLHELAQGVRPVVFSRPVFAARDFCQRPFGRHACGDGGNDRPVVFVDGHGNGDGLALAVFERFHLVKLHLFAVGLAPLPLAVISPGKACEFGDFVGHGVATNAKIQCHARLRYAGADEAKDGLIHMRFLLLVGEPASLIGKGFLATATEVALHA